MEQEPLINCDQLNTRKTTVENTHHQTLRNVKGFEAKLRKKVQDTHKKRSHQTLHKDYSKHPFEKKVMPDTP